MNLQEDFIYILQDSSQPHYFLPAMHLLNHSYHDHPTQPFIFLRVASIGVYTTSRCERFKEGNVYIFRKLFETFLNILAADFTTGNTGQYSEN